MSKVCGCLEDGYMALIGKASADWFAGGMA